MSINSTPKLITEVQCTTVEDSHKISLSSNQINSVLDILPL